MRIRVKGTTLIYCPHCGSANVKHDTPTVVENELYRYEIYNVRCENCGAKGFLEEHWEKDGDT